MCGNWSVREITWVCGDLHLDLGFWEELKCKCKCKNWSVGWFWKGVVGLVFFYLFSSSFFSTWFCNTENSKTSGRENYVISPCAILLPAQPLGWVKPINLNLSKTMDIVYCKGFFIKEMQIGCIIWLGVGQVTPALEQPSQFSTEVYNDECFTEECIKHMVMIFQCECQQIIGKYPLLFSLKFFFGEFKN